MQLFVIQHLPRR